MVHPVIVDVPIRRVRVLAEPAEEGMPEGGIVEGNDVQDQSQDPKYPHQPAPPGGPRRRVPVPLGMLLLLPILTGRGGTACRRAHRAMMGVLGR